MTSWANAELCESVGGGGFPLPFGSILVCSEDTQHPFLTINRKKKYFCHGQSLFLRSESVQKDSQAGEKASSPLQL